MRDWRTSLRPAAINGLPFQVSSDEIEAGHRLATEGIPNGGYVVESFGRKLRIFNVTAYLAAEYPEAQAEAFLAACETGRPVPLVLPMAGPLLVRVTQTTRRFDRDKLGYIAFDLEAQEEWPEAAGVSVTGLLNSFVGATGLLAVAVAAAFPARITVAAGAVVDAAAEDAAGEVARLADLVDLARPSAAQSAALRPSFAAAAAAVPGVLAAPQAFATAFAAAATALGDELEPLRLGVAFRFLPARPADSRPALGLSSTAMADNRAALAQLGDLGLVLAAAAASARRDWRSREEAVTARLDLQALADAARANLGARDSGIGQALDALVTAHEAWLTAVATDLKPKLRLTSAQPLPALFWSYALYQDIDRVDDLVRQAGASHPLFMPASFEADAA